MYFAIVGFAASLALGAHVVHESHSLHLENPCKGSIASLAILAKYDGALSIKGAIQESSQKGQLRFKVTDPSNLKGLDFKYQGPKNVDFDSQITCRGSSEIHDSRYFASVSQPLIRRGPNVCVNNPRITVAVDYKEPCVAKPKITVAVDYKPCVTSPKITVAVDHKPDLSSINPSVIPGDDVTDDEKIHSDHDSGTSLNDNPSSSNNVTSDSSNTIEGFVATFPWHLMILPIFFGSILLGFCVMWIYNLLKE